MTQNVTISPSIIQENTPEYWSLRFAGKRPLAPTAVREELTDEEYEAGCGAFGDNTDQHYRKFLHKVPAGDVWELGGGNLDDLRKVIVKLQAQGHNVHVADWSPVVVANIREFFLKELNDPVGAENNVHLTDIITALTSLVNFRTTRIIHMSRILDHIEPGARDEVAWRLAQGVRMNDGLWVTIINHDTDDNAEWLEKWTTVFPFNIPEFVRPLTRLLRFTTRGGTRYRISTEAETGPWTVFGEVFRATTVKLVPR